MSEKWYLINSPYSQYSGYEDEAFEDFAHDSFEEALMTNMASDVEVCNYDLTERIRTRAIIQNSMQDTKLKSLNRHALLPIGTCKAGMYVFYKNRYWLIVGLVDDNGVYEKAIMIICNHLLTWINNAGNTVQRWVNASSASQYNNGETGMKYYTVRSDQLMILTPNDDQCLLLNTGQRFIIDKRCQVYEKEFDDNVSVNTSKPVITYELTRADSVIYDYQDSGHSEFIAYQDEQHKNDGYYVIDGKGYWLCDIPDKSDTKKESRIKCDSCEIYNGIDEGIFAAEFYDENGEITLDVIPEWHIESDFNEKLKIENVSNSIIISVNDKALTNKSFVLSLRANGYESVSKTITIRTFI